MKYLIECIIKKWFCCHEWEIKIEEDAIASDIVKGTKQFTIYHLFCKKCGKYKKIAYKW